MPEDIPFEDKCIYWKDKGLTQIKAAKKLGVCKETLINRLRSKGLKWSELISTKGGSTGGKTSSTNKPNVQIGAAAPPKHTSVLITNSPGGSKKTPLTAPPFDLTPELSYLMMYGKQIPHWLAPFFLKLLEKSTTVNSDLYVRPDWLYPHQVEFINLMKKGNIFLYGMRQLTGKTVGTHVANLELQHLNPGWRTTCMSQSMDLSKKVFIKKIKQEDILWKLYEPHLKQILEESYILSNKSGSQLFPMNARAIQGPTGNTVWVDETDKVVDEPQGKMALAGIIPQLLKTMLEGKGHLWFTCNLGTTRTFHSFMHVIEKLGYPFFPVVEILEPTADLPRRLNIRNKHIKSPDISVMNQKEKEAFLKQFMYDLLKALVDEQYAKALILNVEDWSKDPFPPELLDIAFDRERYVKAIPLVQEPCYNWAQLKHYKEYLPIYHWDWETQFPQVNQYYDTSHNVDNIRVMYIDPGFKHALGVLILAHHKTHQIHELFAKELFGGEISEEDMKELVYLLCRAFGVQLLIIESNSGGLWWAEYFEKRGIEVVVGGYGTANAKTGDVAGKHLERTYYERILKDSLEKERLYLFSAQFRTEWDAYDLSHKNKEEGKGDLMDCGLQCNYEVVGGSYYLNILLNGKEGYDQEDQVVFT